MEQMKRSEKYKKFKDCGIPRYLMLDHQEKKKESIMLFVISLMMFVLAFFGKTEWQRSIGLLLLFGVNTVSIINR